MPSSAPDCCCHAALLKLSRSVCVCVCVLSARDDDDICVSVNKEQQSLLPPQVELAWCEVQHGFV